MQHFLQLPVSAGVLQLLFPSCLPKIQSRFFSLEGTVSVLAVHQSALHSSVSPLFCSQGRLMSCKRKKKRKASMDSYRAPSTSQGDCNHGLNFSSPPPPPSHTHARQRQIKEGTLNYFNVKFSALITRREDRTVDPPRLLNLPGCNIQIQCT